MRFTKGMGPRDPLCMFTIALLWVSSSRETIASPPSTQPRAPQTHTHPDKCMWWCWWFFPLSVGNLSISKKQRRAAFDIHRVARNPFPSSVLREARWHLIKTRSSYGVEEKERDFWVQTTVPNPDVLWLWSSFLFFLSIRELFSTWGWW